MALVKLQIQAYSDAACTSKVGQAFEVMFNPENYQRNYTVEYNSSNVAGENNNTLLFRGMKGSDLKLKLVADGTGVAPLPKGISDVDAYIKKIQDLTYSFKGTVHRPSFLKIVWGTLSVICVCKTLNISYNLFKPDGTTLRATIDLGLSETIDFKTKAKEAQKSSPDLTHIRTVGAGDTLPLMTYKIYGNSSYYMDVARLNGLKSVLDIKPGDQIYFPPIKK
jgi:LysM repeat protein